MKKLLLVLLATALTGSFTSCVENEIPDEVTAIYENQADLIAAKAALEVAAAAEANARAAYLDAQASVQESQADLNAAQAEMQRIMNEMMVASNAIELDRLQALLEVQKAQYASDIAFAELQAERDRIAAEQAQLQWMQTQAALQDAIAAAEEAKVQAAYAEYLGAVTMYNGLVQTEINQRLAVLNQMDVINDGMVNDAASLAVLESAVTAEQATIADLEGQIADLEALLASGDVADYNAQLQAYKDRIAEIAETLDEWTIAVELANQELTAAQAEVAATGANTVMADYNALQAMHNNVLFGGGVYAGLENDRDAVAAAEAAIEAKQVDIDDLQDIVDNYDTKLADLEAAVAAADAAEEAAEEAHDVAITAEADAATAEADAEQAILDAQADLATLQTAVNNANTNQDQAAVVLAQALANAPTAQTILSLEADVDAALVDLATAQAEYDAAEAAFALDANGSTVIDTGIDGVAGVIGQNSSWVLITGINNGEPVFNVANKFESQQAAIDWMEDQGQNGVTLQDGNNANAQFASDPFDNYNQGATTTNNNGEGDYWFFNVAADDTVVNNLARLQQANNDLDAAKVDLSTAKQALETANNYSTATEQAAYDEAKNIYENALDLLEAQQEVVDDAIAAEVIAEKAHDDAIDAEVAAATAEADAEVAEAAAMAALTTFENTTETEYQDQLQGAIADKEYLVDTLAEAEATLAANIALSDDLAAQIDAGVVFTDEQTAAIAAQDEAQMALDALNALQAPLVQEDNNLDALVTIVEGILNSTAANFDAGNNTEEAIEMAIEGLMNQLEVAQTALETAQDNVAKFTDGSAAAQAELERRQATLASTQALIEAWQARVDRRLAILEALL